MRVKNFFRRRKKIKEASKPDENLKEELHEVLSLYTKSLESLRDELHEVKEDCLELLRQRGLPLDKS